MATYDWVSGVTGSWRAGANWSGGIQPTSGDIAVIDAAPVGKSYHVAINKPVTTGEVILNQAAAYLTVASTFDVGNLELQAGTLEMKGGTLTGTVTQQGNVVLEVHNDYTSTLTDVTWNGTLTPIFQRYGGHSGKTPGTLVIAGGLTLNGADGTGPGTLSLAGETYGSIDLIGIETLNNVMITGNYYERVISDSTNFTFGGTVDAQNANFEFGSGATLTNLGLISGGDYLVPDVVNDGTIAGNAPFFESDLVTNNGTIVGSIYVDGYSSRSAKFVNNGAINIGQSQYIFASSIVNNGTATVASGASLYLDAGNVRSGAHGAIDLDGGALVVKGKFTTASLASELAAYSVHFAGAGAGIGIDGSLDNTGATLTTTSGLGALYAFDTEIDGGAIVDANGAIDLLEEKGLDLEGVAYRGGDLVIPGELTLGDGSTIARSDSSTPTITLVNGGTLALGENQVLSGVAIDTGSAYGEITLDQGAVLDDTQITLAVDSQGYAPDIISAVAGRNYGTLGAGVTVTLIGTPQYYGVATISIGTNEGIVNVTSGSALYVTAAGFVNSGTIDVTSGTLAISGETANSGAITLDSGSLLELGDTITMKSFTEFTLDNTAISLDGTFDLQGSTVTPGIGAVPDFELGKGAQITDGTLAVASGQTLIAGYNVPSPGFFDPFVASLGNNGVVSASGLTVDAVTGTGTIDLVGPSSYGPALTCEGTSSGGGFGAGQTVDFVAASSQLGFADAGAASTFAGTLSNFSVGDSLYFISESNVRSASFSSSGIVVKFASGASATLATSSALSGDLTISVSNHETLITYTSAGNGAQRGLSDWSATSSLGQAGGFEVAARAGFAHTQPEHDVIQLWPMTTHLAAR